MYSEGQQPTRLNLGAGAEHLRLPGYHHVDRATGEEVYPLTGYVTDSCEEIRASHILEHFSHRKVPDVLKEWVRVLKPGGCLKLAVPDFDRIARAYLEGKAWPIQSFLMGGHNDDADKHGCIFDRESLTEAMAKAGLERIGDWKSEIQDCASYEVSLNLKGYKPLGGKIKLPMTDVVALLSAPRFGPVMHFRVAMQAFIPLGIRYSMGQGAYWHQILAEQMEAALEWGAKYILTCDYDTVFRSADVLELYRVMEAMPDCDAVCPVQQKRQDGTALFTVVRNGKHLTELSLAELDRFALPILTGHFGLTLIRADSLRSLPRPWFTAHPNADNRWVGEKIDPDSQFWLDWKAAGKTLYLAPRVVVGHLEEIIGWPGPDLKTVYQTCPDYESRGIPAEVER